VTGSTLAAARAFLRSMESPVPHGRCCQAHDRGTGYPTYCKALRLLIRDGRSFEAIQRTVCWERLSLLQKCLPGRYKSPDYLYALLKREVEQPAI
jgi:hypothetical protein